MKVFVALLELAGFVAIVIGASMLAGWLGWVVGGLFAVLVAGYVDVGDDL